MACARRKQAWWVAILVVAVLWTGLLLGVSFLATPVKFLAPSLALPVALDVGRHTFAVYNKAEWVLALVLLALMAGSRPRLSTIMTLGIAAIVILETFWLMPVLDYQVSEIIAGQKPPASSEHMIYISLEIAKLLGLVAVVVDMIRQILRQSESSICHELDARAS